MKRVQPGGSAPHVPQMPLMLSPREHARKRRRRRKRRRKARMRFGDRAAETATWRGVRCE